MNDKKNYAEETTLLLTSLQDLVQKQTIYTKSLEQDIDDLQNKITLLKNENENLLLRNKQLQNEIDIYKEARNHKKVDENSSDEDEITNPSNNSPSTNLQATRHISRSSSIMQHTGSEGDLNDDNYELSADLQEKQIEMMKNFYGGSERCEKACKTIQYAYRSYKMKSNFKKISQSSNRRRLTVDCVKEIPVGGVWQKEQASVSDSEVGYDVTSAQKDSSVSSGASVEDIRTKDAADDQSDKDQTTEVALENDDVIACKTNDVTTLEDANKPCDDVTIEEADVTIEQADVTIEEADDDEEEVFDRLENEFKLIEKEPVSPRQLEVKAPAEAPDEAELVRMITENQVVLPHTNPQRKHRKRHGYETVLDFQPKQSEQIKQQEEKSSDVIENNLSFPPITIEDTSTSSSQNFEFERDQDSIRSLDTNSLSSDLSTTASSTTNSEQGYHRHSTVSRESWNSGNDVLRKRLYRIGLNLFNRKPSKGLDFLIEKQFVVKSPPAIAYFLLNRKGLSRQMVGEYLGGEKPFCAQIRESVCELLDFSNLDLDEALRKFQAEIRVQGEAQRVERLVEAFAQRYCACNPKVLGGVKNADSVFIAAFAIIMLNTDLHSPNLRNEKRMTESEFIKNLRGIDDGNDLSEELLRKIYSRIKENELITHDDHVSQVLQVENCILGKKPNLAVPYRRLVCYCRLFQVTDPSKPQRMGLHQREVFLFNDMILVTKILQKKRNSTTYSFKQSFSLCGLSFFIFTNSNYHNGVRLVSGGKTVIAFNAPNEQDREKFVCDLKESIAEVEQMEALRIGELDKVGSNNSPLEHRRNSLALADTKKISSSMHNLNGASTNIGLMEIVKGLFHRSSSPGAAIRPTSMYSMGGDNLSCNNNKNHLYHQNSSKNGKTAIRGSLLVGGNSRINLRSRRLNNQSILNEENKIDKFLPANSQV